ncbi:hypothetical protein [uncultured Ruegeria sp.]|uniref:hypothetical protein n=1 Tax=uncultured Ruegeria sp. TaxID=259304 RepID=UPI0026123FBA|nr:hypothetical protein [uncultured Ruegeria sp.]
MLLLIGACPVVAKTNIESAAFVVPECQTNVDEKGSLIAGLLGTASAPVEYDNVLTDHESISIFPRSRSGLNVEVQASKHFGLGTSNVSVDTSNFLPSIILTFVRREQSIAHICSVQIVEYDPDLHETATIQFGECSLKQVSGAEVLLPGHVQICESPEQLDEVSGRPLSFVDVVPITGRFIQVRGQSEGLGVFSWNSGLVEGADSDVHELRSICPVWVVERAPAEVDHLLQTTPLCQDIDGKDLEMKVGERTNLSLSSFNRNINFSPAISLKTDHQKK